MIANINVHISLAIWSLPLNVHHATRLRSTGYGRTCATGGTTIPICRSAYRVKLSRHIGCRGSSYVDCYHPATMRVNKQVRYEYMTIVMPRMMLCVNWWIRARRTMFFFKPSDLSYPILPMTIFSQLRFLHLDAVIYSSFPSQSPYLDFSVMKLSTDSTRRPFKCSISLLRSHTSNAPAKLLFVHHEILAGR
jgi:hypothetical protein